MEEMDLKKIEMMLEQGIKMIKMKIPRGETSTNESDEMFVTMGDQVIDMYLRNDSEYNPV